MLRPDQYDKGVLATRKGFVSRLLSKYFPVLLLLGAVVSFPMVFLGSTLKVGEKLQISFATSFFCVLVAFTLQFIGSYLISEEGRLTYDRIRTVSYSLASTSPKSCGLFALLCADTFWLPIVLMSHPELTGGTPLHQALTAVLLVPQYEPGVYIPVFWVVFVLAIAVFGVGVCCIAPNLAYSDSHTKPSPRRILVYVLFSVLLTPIFFHWLAAIPCDLTSSKWAASPSEPCDGHLHRIYLSFSATLLVLFGTVAFSVNQQFTVLDDYVNVIQIHPIRADPVGLGLGMLFRGVVLVSCAVQLPAKISLALILSTALFYILWVSLYRFSTVRLLNSFVRLSAFVNGATCLIAGLILIVRGAGSQPTQAFLLSPDNNQLQSTGDIVLQVIWGIVFFSFPLVTLGYQCAKHHCKFFQHPDEGAANLEDIAAEVYL
jgi:hypothetical protein